MKNLRLIRETKKTIEINTYEIIERQEGGRMRGDGLDEPLYKHENITIYRVEATNDFKIGDIEIPKGRVGGWLDKESFSKIKNSWVDNDAVIVKSDLENSIIEHNAFVQNSILKNGFMIDTTKLIDSKLFDSNMSNNAFVQESSVKKGSWISANTYIQKSALENTDIGYSCGNTVIKNCTIKSASIHAVFTAENCYIEGNKIFSDSNIERIFIRGNFKITIRDTKIVGAESLSIPRDPYGTGFKEEKYIIITNSVLFGINNIRCEYADIKDCVLTNIKLIAETLDLEKTKITSETITYNEGEGILKMYEGIKYTEKIYKEYGVSNYKYTYYMGKKVVAYLLGDYDYDISPDFIKVSVD
jgi:hypothetical protein